MKTTSSNSAPSHLTQAAAECLMLPKRERIARIRAPRWIGYPRAREILDKLEDLLIYPRSHRMPNLLIVGDTNNGKTMLVDRFRQSHPADSNPNGQGVLAPVITVQAPPVPDEGRFYNAILELLVAPFRHSDRVDKKMSQAVTLLRYVQVRMLVIDEIHHILAGNLNKQRAFLNVLKFLGNELQISIVGVGTKDAFRAIQTDPQLANRFQPLVLPRWTIDEQFYRLLVSFERMIPLAVPSNLHEPNLAGKLHAMSEGYIGELSRLLTEAAVLAVNNERERIDLRLLAELDWTSPSERKQQLDQRG